VAAAIVGVLRRPRLEVFVPKRLGAMHAVRALPRSVGEWVLRLGGSDRLLAAAAGSAERADYERRAAASAPGADER
jgi:hypothetical protein